MRASATAAVIFLIVASRCQAAELSPAADRAYREYAAALEGRLAKQHTNAGEYLAVLQKPAAERNDTERQLRSGVVRVEPVNGGMQRVNGAMLHHWRGAAFVPRARATDMLRLLRDCKGLAAHYAPEVNRARCW